MSKGWVVTYNDGESVIMSEKAFAEHNNTIDKTSVESEVSYLDMREAVKNYPWLEVRE